MATPLLSGFIKVGLGVLSTVVKANGLILAQLGSVTNDEVESDDSEWWQHVGFASRPASANASHKSAQAVTIKGSNHDVIVASRDQRGATIIGNLGEGETCVYATGADGSATVKMVLKGDNSVTIESPLGTIDITSAHMSMVNSGGKGITVDSSGKVTIECTTLRINGTDCQINTATAEIGQVAVAAGTAPNPALAAIIGPSGMAGVASTSVKIST